MQTLFLKQPITLQKELILYHEELDSLEDFRLISVFKISIWNIRNLIKYQKIEITNDFFKNLFKKNLIKYSC